MRNSIFPGPHGRQNKDEKLHWIYFLCKINTSGLGLKTVYNAKQFNWDTWKWTAYQ